MTTGLNSSIGGSYQLIPVDAALLDIYRVVRSQSPDAMSEDDMKEAVYFAANQLYNHKYYENAMCIGALNNYKTVIPNYRKVLQVYWKPELNEGEMKDLITTTTTDSRVQEEDEGYITYKYPFALSQSRVPRSWTFCYPKHGVGQMMNSMDGSMQGCHITYSLKQCILSLSKESGYVAVLYDRLLRNDEGELLMPVIPEFIDAIRSYVLMEISLRNVMQHTEGSIGLYDRFKDEWEKKQAEVRAKLMMLDLPEYISMINENNSLVAGTDPYTRHTSAHNGPEYMW